MQFITYDVNLLLNWVLYKTLMNGEWEKGDIHTISVLRCTELFLGTEVDAVMPFEVRETVL